MPREPCLHCCYVHTPPHLATACRSPSGHARSRSSAAQQPRRRGDAVLSVAAAQPPNIDLDALLGELEAPEIDADLASLQAEQVGARRKGLCVLLPCALACLLPCLPACCWPPRLCRPAVLLVRWPTHACKRRPQRRSAAAHPPLPPGPTVGTCRATTAVDIIPMYLQRAVFDDARVVVRSDGRCCTLTAAADCNCCEPAGRGV